MPPAPIPERTTCETLAEWSQHVKNTMEVIDQPETEVNWDRMERSYMLLASVVRGGAYKLEADFVPGVRTIARPTNKAMVSERTRLSGAALELVSVIGARMGIKFEPLVPLYVPTVLKLCTRSSKIYVGRAQACLKLFASHCRVPALVSLFKEAVTDKSQTLRISATDALHDFLSTSVRDGLPRVGKWIEDVEWIIKATARDATPETRKLSRRVFATYAQLWPERVNDFTFPLSPVTRRYLEITNAPNSNEPSKHLQAPIPAPALSEPVLSQSKTHIGLAARPGPHPRAATSHNRTLSDQPVSSTPRAPLNPMRSVAASHLREPILPPSRSTRGHHAKEGEPSAPAVPSKPMTTGSRNTGTISGEERRPVVVGGPHHASGMRVELLRNQSSRTIRPKPRAREDDTLAALIAEEQRERERALEIPLPDSDSDEESPLKSSSRPVVESASTPQIVRQEVDPIENVAPVRVQYTPTTVERWTFRGTGHGMRLVGHTTRQEEETHQSLAASQEHEIKAESLDSSSVRNGNGESEDPVEAAGSVQSSTSATAKPTSKSTTAVVKSELPSRHPRLPLPPAQVIHRAPGFKPRRGRDDPANAQDHHASVQGSEQPRKVSAFGVPSVITVPNKSRPPTQETEKKNTIISSTSTISKAHPPVDTTSVRSVSSSRPPSALSGARTTPSTGQKAGMGVKPKVSAPGAAPKPEARSRNATGMTASQLAKQKPPVRRAGAGFVPTSKLRGTATIAPGPEKSLRAESKAAVVSGEAEVAARIPLPPTPDPGAASEEASDVATLIPLPTSPTLEAATDVISSISSVSLPPVDSIPIVETLSSARITASEERNLLDNGFPTIESIKARLSDVLQEAKSMARRGSPTPSTSGTAGDFSKAAIQDILPGNEGEEDVEFKLTDLDAVPQAPVISLVASNDLPDLRENGIVQVNGDLGQQDRRHGLAADALTVTPSPAQSFVTAMETTTEYSGPTKPSERDAQKGPRVALTDKGINVRLD